MKTFSIDKNMTVVIDHIRYVRYFPSKNTDPLLPDFWSVEVSFGNTQFSIAYTCEDDARKVYEQVTGLLVECK